MQKLLNFTEQYLPELEKVSKGSKSTSFRFKGKKFKLKTKKPKKPLDLAQKVARTVFKSMQAHVNRLTKHSQKYMDLSNLVQSRIQNGVNPMPYENRISKNSIASMKRTSKMKYSSLARPSLSNKRGLRRFNVSSLTDSNRKSKPKSKKNKLKKSSKKSKLSKNTVKKEAEVKNVYEMNKDELLTCLKSLQKELSALKVPDFPVSSKEAGKDKKSSNKKKSKRHKVRKSSEIHSSSMLSGDEFDFGNEYLSADEGCPDVYSSIRRFTDIYGTQNNPLANAFGDAAFTGLNMEMTRNNVSDSRPGDFFEWAQRPLKGIKFPEGVA